MEASFSKRRLAAVLGLLGSNYDRLARLIGCSDTHLHEIVAGIRRPSERLAIAIHQQLAPYWDFIHGRTDVLLEADAALKATG